MGLPIGALVRMNTDGTVSLTDTVANAYGIIAENAPAGTTSVVYMTGEFIAHRIVLPAGITWRQVDDQFRTTGRAIFLKESIT
jgi:hypothetical protein